jgi:hypothetical protein
MHECTRLHVFWNEESTLKGAHRWKPKYYVAIGCLIFGPLFRGGIFDCIAGDRAHF